jgi:hypothetical protein
VIDTQLASVLIDHVQSRAVVIATAPGPPVAVKVDGALLTLTWHLSAVGAAMDVWVELHAEIRQASAGRQVAASARKRQRMRYLPGVDRTQAPRHNHSRNR